jgi:prevent-host-death family protein
VSYLYLDVHGCTFERVSVQMTVSEARAALPALLDRVTDGEEVTITRHGRPVAVLVRPDRLRVRRAEEAMTAAAKIHDLLERGAQTPLGAGGLTIEQAEESVADVYRGRAER